MWPEVSRRLFISGRVQGVGYRWHMVQAARSLGVSGWVRNRGDGSVEALLCGPQEAVARLTDWARRGPPQARVERVEVTEADERASGFTQRPSVFP